MTWHALDPESDAEPEKGLVITAINCTAGIQQRARSFHKILDIIPNLSYLVGAVSLGHNVVAFEGLAGDLASACTGRDMLLLDDGMVPFLQPDWAAIALPAPPALSSSDATVTRRESTGWWRCGAKRRKRRKSERRERHVVAISGSRVFRPRTSRP